MKKKFTHLMYTPFTGLGLYGGFRGNRWLKNRIKVFKQFVVPSLLAQTNKNFVLWVSWRPEEKNNIYVKELWCWLKENTKLEIIFTYHGIMFWDDKYPDAEANDRLLTALNSTMGEMTDVLGECEEVLMTLQPSDDCYNMVAVDFLQKAFEELPVEHTKAIGFTQGYMMDYTTKTVAEYNPKTNPPFFTIRFPRATFINPIAHSQYIAVKYDVGGYKSGTPYPSHEYLKDVFDKGYRTVDNRAFLVGTHGENISTIFNHPFRGATVSQDVLKDFGLYDIPALVFPRSWRRDLLRKMPYKVQRKLRYWAGEKKWILRPLFSLIYNGLRS